MTTIWPPEVTLCLRHPEALAEIPPKRRHAIAVLLANAKLGLPMEATKADRQRAKKERRLTGGRP
jgi:hypothetical protein